MGEVAHSCEHPIISWEIARAGRLYLDSDVATPDTLMMIQELILAEIGETGLEVFRFYRYALEHIGVDFGREDVARAVVSNYFNMEKAFQTTISYWHWRDRSIEHPSAFLISALDKGWKPYEWNDNWLNDPALKNPCLKWWEEAERGLVGYRNAIVADVNSDEHGNQYVLFTHGKMMRLETAKRIGWERLLNYATEQGLIPEGAVKSSWWR